MTPEIEEIRAALLESLAQRAALDAQMADVMQKAMALFVALYTLDQVRVTLGASIDMAKELFNANFPPGAKAP